MSKPAMASVADLVARAAEESPDRLALVECAGRSLTWAQLEDQVGRVATGLVSSGVVAGYRVVIALGNRIEFVSGYLGTLRAGAVAVPVNPRATAGEVARMLADSGARVVIADVDTVLTVREAVAVLDRALAGTPVEADGVLPEDLVARAVRPRVVVVGGTLLPGERGWDQLVATAGAPQPRATDPERLACLLYTSGTSGRPRAAMLSHRALLANTEQIARVEPPMIHSDDVVLGVLPLFHVYGLNAVLGTVLRRRARLVLTPAWDPESVLDLIDDEAVSVLPVAPPVFAYWRGQAGLRERLGPVRLVLSGSAPLSPELVTEFTEATGLAVHEGYGLTEAAPVVTSTLCSTAPVAGSVGAPLPGIEVRVVDEAGRPPEPHDPGEIEVRGPNLFSGYWPDGDGAPGADGWWATGDVGYLDARGDLVLVDRLKELVIVSGFNVYPTEVEDVVAEVDGVTAVGVVGAADPDTGEAVVAYVQAPGRDPEVVVAAVREHCARRLARFKQPSRVEVVDQLPVTVTGKVRKGTLRAAERRRMSGLLE